MNKPAFKYDFAKQFSKFPGGRYRRHGPASGEEFRDDVMRPLLDRHDKIELDLTGVRGFGSSFLDECFGDIGKELGLSESRRRITFICEDDPTLVEMIWAKIKKATSTK